MAKIVKEWSKGSISIAVEIGRDDMNRDGTHVHIYKRGRRTDSRIPGKNRDLDELIFYLIWMPVIWIRQRICTISTYLKLKHFAMR